jgi:hypothetical protein
MAGGLGGVIVAGAAVGWAVESSGRTAGTGQLAGGVSRRGTGATARATLSGATAPKAASGGKPPGTVLWHAVTGVNPNQLAVATGVVAVSSADNRVNAFDVATGAHRWTWPMYEVLLVKAQGETVVVTGWDGPFRVIGLAAATGRQQWTGSCNNDSPEMGIGGDLCVVPVAGGTGFTAYNLSTGARAWTFRGCRRPERRAAGYPQRRRYLLPREYR